MLSSVLNLSASHTTVQSPGSLCGSLNALDTLSDHQTQHLSDNTVAGSSSVNTRTIDDFSVKLANTPASALASVKKGNKAKTHKADKQSGRAAIRPPEPDKKKYICNICGKELSRNSSLKEHQQIHETRSIYSCPVCQKQFISKSGLKVHKQKFHENSKYLLKCNVCSKKFLHKSRFNAHQKTHSPDSYPCQQCGRCFKIRESLCKHVAFMHTPGSKTRHICTVCNKIFPDRSHMEAHQLTHNNKTFNHSHDYMGSTDRECFDKHTNRTHTTDRTSHKCNNCNKLFATLHKLKQHQSTCKERKHVCDICLARFPRPFHLQRHHTTVHSGKRNYLCDKCGNTFTSYTTMTRHINSTHIKNKWLECEYCHKRFSRVDCLKKHLLLHARKRNHTQCDTGFTHQTQSDNHNREHMNKKDYEYSDEYSKPENPEPEKIWPLHIERNHDDSQNTRNAAKTYEHENQEIPEERLPEKQNNNGGYVINEAHSTADQPSATNSTHVNKSEDQEEYEELVNLLYELGDTLLKQAMSSV